MTQREGFKLHELLSLSATQVAKAIQNGKVSSEEITLAALERIHQVNPALNAVVALASDRAMEEANTVEEEERAQDELLEEMKALFFMDSTKPSPWTNSTPKVGDPTGCRRVVNACTKELSIVQGTRMLEWLCSKNMSKRSLDKLVKCE